MSRRRPDRPLRFAEGLPRSLEAAALFLCTFVLYLPSISNGLTNWDDPDYVINNPFVAQGWHGLIAAFTTPFDGVWYPFTHALYVLVAQLGMNLHLVGVLLFAATVAMLPTALATFSVPRVPALITAALWAAHPFRVESVSWAANLKDTLGAFFIVAAFACWPRTRVGASVLLVSALLAKSAFFGLGLVFPLIEVASGRKANRAWAPVVIALIIAVVAGVLHQGTDTFPFSTRLATAAANPWWYLSRIVMPWGSRALYDLDGFTFGSAWFIASVPLWVGLAIATWKAPFRVPMLLAIAVALLALAPVSGLVSLGHLRTERYTLFPSLALFAGLSALAWRPGREKVVLGAAAIVLVVLIPMNVIRQRQWHDALSLWAANEPLAPKSWELHINYAEAAADAKQFELAQTQTEAALALRPDNRDALAQLIFFAAARDGIPPEENARLQALMRDGQGAVLDAAEWCLAHQRKVCTRAVLDHAGPSRDTGKGQRLLSALERREQRLPQSLAAATRALELGERKALIELVFALADAGRASEAITRAETSLGDPRSDALLRGARAYALAKAGRTDEARSESSAAIEDLQRIEGG